MRLINQIMDTKKPASGRFFIDKELNHYQEWIQTLLNVFESITVQ